MVKLSEISELHDLNLPIFRKVCIPKRVTWAYFTYAPLVAFILNTILLAGHVILLPYYLLSILSKGKPPKFLYVWVYINSAYLYGAIHEKDEVWFDFWCLYYIYIGYIVAFIVWILNVVSLLLIFPIFYYIEEWRLMTNVQYRITFGNWKKLVNECPEMRYKRGVQDQERKEKRTIKEEMKKAKKQGKYHDVTVEIVNDDMKTDSNKTMCPTCGEAIETNTVYCQKCGSYVKN